MPSAFSPRLDILPLSQRRLWGELTGVLPEFVLYGGTAIALHLGHRQSVDFDFFGINRLNRILALAIAFLAGAMITRREPNTLGCVLDRGGTCAISFFGVPGLPRLRPPLVAPGNGLRARVTPRPCRDEGVRRADASRGEGLHRYRRHN